MVTNKFRIRGALNMAEDDKKKPKMDMDNFDFESMTQPAGEGAQEEPQQEPAHVEKPAEPEQAYEPQPTGSEAPYHSEEEKEKLIQDLRDEADEQYKREKLEREDMSDEVGSDEFVEIDDSAEIDEYGEIVSADEEGTDIDDDISLDLFDGAKLVKMIGDKKFEEIVDTVYEKKEGEIYNGTGELMAISSDVKG